VRHTAPKRTNAQHNTQPKQQGGKVARCVRRGKIIARCSTRCFQLLITTSSTRYAGFSSGIRQASPNTRSSRSSTTAKGRVGDTLETDRYHAMTQPAHYCIIFIHVAAELLSFRLAIALLRPYSVSRLLFLIVEQKRTALRTYKDNWH
jgi:hypothetical protein